MNIMLQGLPKINFDPKSLAFGGAMVIVTSLLASVFSKGITVPNHRYSRQDDYNMPDGFIDVANIIISNGQSCPARLACWAGRTANIRNLNTWKKITRNQLLSSMFNTTSVEDAYRAGRTGGDCNTFRPCPLNEYQLTQIIDNISSYRNTFISNIDNN
ncbi:PREDICTED: uncharacterized protein LOC106119904 [Papilio xuthus]|uniref:Uncharacterized protein LOC106119904 n=2 Tax=Papilio xuthus TaxID=66420 RepID=A0AAJ6ZDY6_PAPXU|nr:PREDICTED: uncharacterized protein LOC106119904 [Papilio xuthus]